MPWLFNFCENRTFMDFVGFLSIKINFLYVTGPAKIDHVSAKNRRFLACLLYHN